MKLQSSALLLGILAAGRGTDSKETQTIHQELHSIHAFQRDYLLATDRFYSFVSGSLGIIEGFTAQLSRDALYLHAGADIIQGREVAEEFLAGVFTSPTSLTWRAASGDVSEDGRLGYTWGWTELSIDGGPVQHGKYISFWKLERGLWKVIAYVRNPSPGPPPPPPDDFPLLRGGHGAPHPGDIEELRMNVLDTDSQFSALSVEQGRAVAFPAYADENAVQLPGGAPMLFGREEIGQFFSTAPIENVLSWTPGYVDVSASGDLAYTVGRAVFTVPQPDGTVTRSFSKYLTVWARQEDGSWKYILDGGNASPARPP